MKSKNKKSKIDVLIFMHSIYSPAGELIEWVCKNNKSYKIYFWGVDNMDQLQNLKFDWLVVMGGFQNVDEEDKYPWLKTEKKLIAKAIQQKKIVLGICLGGQLLAEILGAQVGPLSHWELGWSEIKINCDASDNKSDSDISNTVGNYESSDDCKTAVYPLSTVIPKIRLEKVFQHHKYAFTIPSGAQSFARNPHFPNQGFILDDRVIGIQFHPEATKEWVRGCAQRLSHKGPFVQTKSQILEDLKFQEQSRLWFFELLNNLNNLKKI